MRAALVEQDDIAAGTSSRSSRLIHGGLRYLEQFRFGLVREALAERSRLLRSRRTSSASSRCCSRSTASRSLSKAFYDAGLTLYDILGARHDGGWHRRLSKAETLELAPTLRHDGLRGGLSTTTGWRTTRATRSPSPARRSPPAASAVTRVRATGLRAIEATGAHRGAPGART